MKLTPWNSFGTAIGVPQLLPPSLLSRMPAFAVMNRWSGDLPKIGPVRPSFTDDTFSHVFPLSFVRIRPSATRQKTASPPAIGRARGSNSATGDQVFAPSVERSTFGVGLFFAF